MRIKETNVLDLASDESRYEIYSSAAKSIAESMMPVRKCFVCKEVKRCPTTIFDLLLCDSKECGDEVVRRIGKKK
jgi:hypothetical protein